MKALKVIGIMLLILTVVGIVFYYIKKTSEHGSKKKPDYIQVGPIDADGYDANGYNAIGVKGLDF